MSPNADVLYKTDPVADDRRDISGPWVEVDLDAITHNINQIRRICCDTPLMPVIKSNAYGHGLIEIARHLEGLAVHGLCVGSFQEAAGLRSNSIACPVLNLGPYSRKEAEIIAACGISQSVFSDDVRMLDDAAAACGRPARVHIKIDTGLGRVGVPYSSALSFIEQVAGLSNVRIEGVFTSLTEDMAFDREQIDRFTEVIRQATAKGIDLGLKHAASSAAILECPEARLDLVRPGIMVFGCYPSAKEFRKRRIDLKPTLTLKARVSFVKRLKAGDSVAYHQAYTARTEETLVTGVIGYPDGYPSQLSENSRCLIGGRRYPLVAGVTANHIYIRADNDRPIEIGDEIVLIGCQDGESVPVESLAEITGISEYKILGCLSPQLPRFYRAGNAEGQ